MRRSLLVRLLGLSLIVAVCSIAATAWLTTRTTSEQVRGEYERTLEADTYIHRTLLDYAHGKESWTGVDPLVTALARETGRRIALTTPDGDILADSAPSTDLPSTPTAAVDVTAPLTGHPADDAAAAGVGIHDDGTVELWWRMTDYEREGREGLAAEATACLNETHDDAPVVLESADVFSGTGIPDDAYVIGDLSADETVIGTSDPGSTSGCLPPELLEPSAAALERNAAEVDLMSACMDEAGAPSEVVTNEHGLTEVVPTGRTADQFAAWEECSASAAAEALAMFTAPAALLYTTSPDRFDPFSGDGWRRTALTALAVLIVGSTVTVVAGRRLTKPVRTLTNAVQRMKSGDRAARVPAHGQDEMARLGRAFNEMAESIESGEQVRRAMVSDVAHELRTPLANVRGYLEAAQDGVVPLDRTLVDSLLEESTTLHHLVEDLQDLALADAGKMRLSQQRCDVAETARQVVAAHQARADDAGVTLAVDAAAPVAVTGDPVRLRQALANLVANAVQYTPRDGTVTVRVAEDHDEAVLAVTDTGRGIDAEHLPHLFDRFYRVDGSRARSTGGSGLGLAITKNLAEAHGGSAAVTSEPGDGATFTLRIPQHTEHVPAGRSGSG